MIADGSESLHVGGHSDVLQVVGDGCKRRHLTSVLGATFVVCWAVKPVSQHGLVPRPTDRRLMRVGEGKPRCVGDLMGLRVCHAAYRTVKRVFCVKRR